ncbi:NACHT domain-containing protein [Streptomyces bauhiniae]|uniref:NACHT domain-containing protein n=1 Tax=Streptomyces bauhiniae TaxID=2340725 RepID=UPI0035E19FE0
MVEVITSALSLLGKAAADPVKDAAFKKPWVISALKKLRLDPKVPPNDFHGVYAYTLVEALCGQPASLLRLFEDEYVQDAFFRSFSDDDWTRLNREMAEAVQRNRETGEYGRLPHDINGEVERFICKFQDLVSRSRTAYEARLENKLDNVSEMLDQVLKTRSKEEEHRQSENPLRAESSPAERLADDVAEWFHAVGYKVRHKWRVEDISCNALLVEVPQRRRGRYDVVVCLCVEGELAPYHMESLKDLVEQRDAAEGWGIAQLRVSSAARLGADQSNEMLSCFSFDELIDLEANFDSYIEWLEEEVRTRHIDTQYVPLACRKEEVDPRTEKSFDASVYDWREGGLDNYVDTWLADPAKKHLSLLGEFGMGKSWFALHLAGRLAAGWKDAKARGVARPRIPLVIPLRDYAKQTSVSALLSEFFFHKHRIEIRNYDVFNVLNRMGRFLLIFDGFDEMASRTDRNTMVANFWELARVVEPGAKVLLSSRTEYFPEAKEARDLFGAQVSTAATPGPSEGPTFEIVELVPFDDEQIRMMLSHILTSEKLEVIMRHEGVRDLMRRPVMSELVLDAMPEIEQGSEINMARIYLYAVKRKMDRDVSHERTFTSRADKLFFLCEVAWEMIRSNQLSLNYRDFPDRLRACFGSAVESSKDLDYWEQDMRNQSMLVRNSRGDYGPSHKSLLEFLVAFRFAAELGLLTGDFLHLIPGAENDHGETYSWSSYFAARGEDGKLPNLRAFESENIERLAGNFGQAEHNPVIFDFLTTMVKECEAFQDILVGHIQATAQVQDAFDLGGNCANLLAQAQGTLAGVSLNETDLSGFGVTGDSFYGISLVGANLEGADLSAADISFLDKRAVNFKRAQLRGSRLLESPATVDHVLIDAAGAITALRTQGRSADLWHRNSCTVMHWPTGNILSTPHVVSLTSNTTMPWIREYGIFGWTTGTWGCADKNGSTIRSSVTGEVLQRTPGMSTFSVPWGDSRALVQVNRQKSGFQWEIVDAVTGRTLVVCDEMKIPTPDVRLWAYRDSGRGLLLRASNAEETYGFELTSENTEWREVYRIPVGLSSRAGEMPAAGSMLKDGVLYLEGYHSEWQRYPVSQFGDLADEILNARQAALTPDAQRLLVSASRNLFMLERSDGQWRKAWYRPLSGSTNSLAISADGTLAVFSLDTGELFTLSLDDGTQVEVITFNETLEGALFSGESGLEPHERETVELAGAVFED